MPTPQTPIHSGYGAATTAAEIVRGQDLGGKIAVVTGGSNGMGLEITRALAGAGAKVVVPARDTAKAAAALAGIPNVELHPMELMDPASIDAFAARVLADHPAVHILILNAGLMVPPLMRDSRGYESQFSTNHLGHFQLTGRLWPALQAAQGARVVAVSSRGHQYGQIDFDDPNFERRPYDPRLAYGQSKTANALFALALDVRGQGDGVRAFSVHPGGVITELAKYIPKDVLDKTGYLDADGKPIIDPDRNMKSPAQGAATAVWCATSPQLNGMGGVYCENCDISQALPADATDELGIRPWAMDPVTANRLWTLSEQLTGIAFP
jgi:NAD(P)-dependent dehydrogenase (short-subunit alcohol dehydrogenase family)